MAQINGKPVSGGQLIVGVIAVLFLIGMFANALGINTTSSAYCKSTEAAINAGTAGTAAIERYYRDCK